MKKEIYKKYFEEKIKPELISLEKERKKLVFKSFLLTFVFFLIGIGFAYLFIVIALNTQFNPIGFPVILFLMYAFILRGIISIILEAKLFQIKVAKEVFPLFFHPVGNFKPWPKDKNTEVILDSFLFPNFDTREDISSFFGFYYNTNIIISDTRLKLPIRGTVKPDLFKGTLIELELNKSIQNHVILISKNERKFNPYYPIKLNIDEMRQFLLAFAANPKNLHIADENLWQVIKRISEVYSAIGFSISIKNNVVLLALKQKNPMHFNLFFKSLLNFDTYDNMVNRFIVIFDLIEILEKSI